MGGNGQPRRPIVCMIAYTDYAFDARVRREAETLALHGFRVLCFSTKSSPEPRNYVLNNVEVRELNVPKYQGKSKVAYLRSYLHFVMASSGVSLGRLFKGELDVVHVHNLPDFLVLAGLLPRLAGRKVVLDVHDSVPETFTTKFSNASLVWNALCLEEKLSALVAHKIICVNDPQRDTLVSRGLPRSKMFISMNVPDPAIFKESSVTRQPSSVGGEFHVVYHGTMAERLGVDVIIRAVGYLRERIPGVHLHLWGNGDDLPGFHALGKELRMDGRIDFQGKGFPLEALPEQLGRMDLGVVGNRRNAASDLMLPVKLMEYVSLGIPVVAPRLRTIEHYFSDDMVAYYEPENIQSFADSIDRLYRNPEARIRQAEQAKQFLGKYGWDLQGLEFVKFYRELVENRK